ncbi:hypothetical protein R6Z02_12670 [Carnobacterium maltaromaticum]|uniref:hypothetical protein n=1 Tax=Carnobacterium maltaromaticum TaxID=2751 RepID=UPI00298B4394|nr:hypothetical protein [Carnobacterium maltaromaticum]MDW5524604.1 hypothetical protein [Carnobacterium maltaromaticum]
MIKPTKKEIKSMSVKHYAYLKEDGQTDVKLLFAKDQWQIIFKNTDVKTARQKIVFEKFEQSDIEIGEVDQHVLNFRRRLSELGSKMVETIKNDKGNSPKNSFYTISQECYSKNNDISNEIYAIKKYGKI